MEGNIWPARCRWSRHVLGRAYNYTPRGGQAEGRLQGDADGDEVAASGVWMLQSLHHLLSHIYHLLPGFSVAATQRTMQVPNGHFNNCRRWTQHCSEDVSTNCRENLSRNRNKFSFIQHPF